ncbi:MAG: UbiA family prenyltransferase [Planctomycetota bacterium]
MNGLSNRLKVYWRLARPFTLLPPLLGMVSGAITALGAAAAAHGQGVGEWLGHEGYTPIGFILIGAFVAAALNAGSNAVNQWTDLANDRINKPHRPIPSGQVTIPEALCVGAVFYLAAIGAAWFIRPFGADPRFLVRNQCFLIVIAGALFTLIYSVPAFGRTKRWAWPAQLTISIPRGCLLKVAGWSCVATVVSDLEPWYIGSIFFLFLLGASATKDFADMEGDRAAGCATLPVRYGPKSAAYQIAPFFVVPWLLIPLGLVVTKSTGERMLTGSPALLLILGVVLVAYGLFTVRLILRDPDELARNENHPSWGHMYKMMMLAQLGLALAYLV